MTTGVMDVAASLGDNRELIGGKAASLTAMLDLGLRVPPAFVLSTDECRRYLETGDLAPDTVEAVRQAVGRLEAATGRTFGDPAEPLLVSVRSGAATSMPGMMDTILNLGMNDETRVGLSRSTSSAFASACHLRFLSAYAEIVHGSTVAVADDPSDLHDELRARGISIPDDPMGQLLEAIRAVFRSCRNDRARAYRARHGIPEDLGTAVIVQAMVFGNRGAASGTGVVFSRNPNTGEPGLYGDYLADAQGDDVVAGTHTTRSIESLAESLPAVAAELEAGVMAIEARARDMVDVEFTVEDGTLYFLQCRTGKRAAAAAVRIAVDLVDEGLIDESEALGRVSPEQRAKARQPSARPFDGSVCLATGLGVCPGVVSGEICLSPDQAEARADDGASVILVRRETSPDDVHGMFAAAGVLTGLGGTVSHAALVARELDLPTVVGASELEIDEAAGQVRAGSTTLKEGDMVTIDGTSGEVFAGEVPAVEAAANRFLDRLNGWASER